MGFAAFGRVALGISDFAGTVSPELQMSWETSFCLSTDHSAAPVHSRSASVAAEIEGTSVNSGSHPGQRVCHSSVDVAGAVE